jgi:hypothetical protein
MAAVSSLVPKLHSQPSHRKIGLGKKRAWKRIKPLHKKRCEYDLILQAEVIFHPGPDL